jgi:hypothetical protein
VASVNVHNSVKVTLNIHGMRHSVWCHAMLALIEQWDVGAHITPDFDSHDANLEWRIINASVKSCMFGTMSLEL